MPNSDVADQLRAEHKKVCLDEFYKAAWKGAAIWGTVSAIATVSGHMYWPFWRNRVGVSIKTFVVAAGMSAGFAIMGEEAEIECSRRLFDTLHPPKKPVDTNNSQ